MILGAIETLSRRVGYDPLAMDPFDGQAYVAATQAALPSDAYDTARAEGRGLDLLGACAVLMDLAATVSAEQPAGATERGT